MGNLFEEILKGALGGDGSILGKVIKNAGGSQQEETTSMGNDANIPKAGNDPFDIGDELDDIANGRNQGTKTTTEDAETGIPSLGGIDIGDILKKIIVGGGAAPSTKKQEEEQASTPTIDIGDILGKLGLGLGSSGAGSGGILQIILQVIKMMKGTAAGQRAGFIEQQLGEYFTPDQVSQLMAAAEKNEGEEETAP